jgi:hypothetical protein
VSRVALGTYAENEKEYVAVSVVNMFELEVKIVVWKMKRMDRLVLVRQGHRKIPALMVLVKGSVAIVRQEGVYGSNHPNFLVELACDSAYSDWARREELDRNKDEMAGPVVVTFWDVCGVPHGIVVEDNVPFARAHVLVEFRSIGYARMLHFDVGRGLETSADDIGDTHGTVGAFHNPSNAEAFRSRENVVGDVAYRMDEAQNRLAPDNGYHSRKRMNGCCGR